MPATAPWTREPLGRAAAGDLETKQEYGMMVEKLSNVTMVNDGDDIFTGGERRQNRQARQARDPTSWHLDIT